jgi:type I restriction enzyme, R subunit
VESATPTLKDNEPKRLKPLQADGVAAPRLRQPGQRDAEAGYTDAEAQEIKAEVEHYEKVREEVKLASGDYIDLKVLRAGHAHLLDTYIRAEESEKVSAFDDMTLVELDRRAGRRMPSTQLPKGLAPTTRRRWPRRSRTTSARSSSTRWP